jgi:hypothetical protein
MNALRSAIAYLRSLRSTMSAPVRYVLAGAIFLLALLLRTLLLPAEE